MAMSKQANGPVNAQIVGGPHDGTPFVIACLEPYVELPDLPGGSGSSEKQAKPRMIRYVLDPECGDADTGVLRTAVARYLYRLRVLASASS